MSKIAIVGWDIGGAHLKFAALDAHGDLLAIEQIPCALWRGLDVLEAAFNKAITQHGLKKAQHFCTMTGELVDLFDNRAQGVQQIAQVASGILGADTRFYAAGEGWVSAGQVQAFTRLVASTNWHTSATWLAQTIPNALLVDIGSTTTDIIPTVGGKVALQGISDAERMRDDTLVYSGVVRTPVMALADKLAFAGGDVNVAAEYFATTADVYRLLGELDARYDMADTADGKGKTLPESARRLARMVGHDLEDRPLQTWRDLAAACKRVQMQRIKTAVVKHLQPNMPILAAGAGAFLVQAVAREIGHACEPISMRLPARVDYGSCLPAYAVAQLAIAHA